jgi:hypothetical protein
VDGHRELRSIVSNELGPLLKSPVKHLREVVSTRSNIFTFLEMDGNPIKVEFGREGNTSLQGKIEPMLGVPMLSRTDLWAQKLLANADRGLDKATLSRDIIDLGMMLRGWGPMPRDRLHRVSSNNRVQECRVEASFQKRSDTSLLEAPRWKRGCLDDGAL